MIPSNADDTSSQSPRESVTAPLSGFFDAKMIRVIEIISVPAEAKFEASHHLAIGGLPLPDFRCFHWTEALLPWNTKESRPVRDSRYRDILSR
jgi:hypothetical protein